MFAIRGGNEYDLANYWLSSKAAPIAFRIKESLNAMTTNQQVLLQTDAVEAKTKLHSLLTMLWILLGIGVVLSVVVGVTLGRSISRPITKITALAENLSTGDINHDIDINSKDEIGQLANSFRSLIDYMKDLAGAAESIAENDLTVIMRVSWFQRQLKLLLPPSRCLKGPTISRCRLTRSQLRLKR
jgi:methyl-accepting chemotaxis protein